MAFVVEDGTGLSNANAFVSVAFFKAYCDDRGISYSAYTDSQIEKAIVLATDYLCFRWEYVGIRLLATQALEWPRTNAWYWDGRGATGIPIEVKHSCCELTSRALVKSLAPDPVYDASGAYLSAKRTKIDVVETDRTFSRSGSFAVFRSYPGADRRLRELIIDGNRVLRA